MHETRLSMSAMDTSPIKVVITDDHPLVRNGLQNVLKGQDNIVVIAEYNTGERLMNGLRLQQPDVLLLDIQLPDKGGDELVPIIMERYPDIRILILTSNDSIYYIKLLVDLGIHGYLLKDTEQDMLVEAIETVYKGNRFFSPQVKDSLLNLSLKPVHTATQEALTPREIEILKLIAQEHTSHEIGEKLFLSYRTVENYRIGIMQKLGVKNMVGMAKKAILMGLIK